MPVNSIESIISRINELNTGVSVNIRRIGLPACAGWLYDPSIGRIRNRNHSFFSIAGIEDESGKPIEQPIIIQDEIGFLGIIRKRLQGEMHYLMQYKIEPGNVNVVQISPTLQATKSNFTQKHGGKQPRYLTYFTDAASHRIVVDQIHSEQSSRFLGKRNRNIIIEIDEDEPIEVSPYHDWMTLAQLKQLMRYDNLVNMDTRTVLSCLPFSFGYGSETERSELDSVFREKEMRRSVLEEDCSDTFVRLYHYMNNYKMFSDCRSRLKPLFELTSWEMRGDEFVSRRPYSFKLIFCDVEIEGREVRKWCQPLLEATGPATFGLFTCVDQGVRRFLVRCKPEVGCFDRIEIGPSVQHEYINNDEKDAVYLLFERMLQRRENVLYDVFLSEEGGRFYHEQNRNVLIEIHKEALPLPKGYFWASYYTLNHLGQFNNTLNIQLRNLISVMGF